MRGSQRLQAVSGNIDTEFGPGDLELKTVSGDIRARGDGKGLVRATTVSGDMEITKGGPELDVNTVSGDMTVSLERLDRGRIKTTNGDLNLTDGAGRGGARRRRSHQRRSAFHLSRPGQRRVRY